MKNIRIFIWKLSVFGDETFNIFEEACFRNVFWGGLAILINLLSFPFFSFFFKGDNYYHFPFGFSCTQIPFRKRGLKRISIPLNRSHNNKSLLLIWFCMQSIKTYLNYEPQRQKTYLRTCSPSKDSDQPAHLHHLLRILVIQWCKVSLCG